MAISKIPEGKKRYQITLTEEKMIRFRKITSELRLPRNYISQLLDEQLDGLSEMLESVKERGTFTLTDLLTLIGKQIEQMEGDKKDAESSSETKKVEG